jgi:hypothetical protein
MNPAHLAVVAALRKISRDQRQAIAVSKDFDTTLADALDLTAGASQTKGAAAARSRGRQRTVRK